MTTSAYGQEEDPGEDARVVDARNRFGDGGQHFYRPNPLVPPQPGQEGPGAGKVLDGELVHQPAVELIEPDPNAWRYQITGRKPVIPRWLRNKRDFKDAASYALSHYTHVSMYHLVRTPFYTLRLGLRSPIGLWRAVSALTAWAFDREAHYLRSSAVLRDDPQAYLNLSRQRDSRVRMRVLILLLAIPALAVAGVMLSAQEAWVLWMAAAAALAGFGLAGAPPGQPRFGQAAIVPTELTPLTETVVVRALGSLNIANINRALGKNGDGITLVAPIQVDGPGWRADIDLPYGVIPGDIMERREQLASGLRRPLGCVWPEGDNTAHAGRLVLWVGRRDMSKAEQGEWPLRKRGQADVFKPMPWGTDQRGRLVEVTIMFTSWLIGAIPRMGKTVAMRLLLLICALDPRVVLYVYDLKGTGDFEALKRIAHRYISGEDDPDVAALLDHMRELHAELRRRAQLIRDMPRDLAPEFKITPELAANKKLGLQPIMIGIDECQRAFEHKKYGAELEEIIEDLIRRGPAVGMNIILATQRPDKDSIPTGISANAGSRYCLKVMGQTENDMVLGTSSYKAGIRATMFALSDKGIGWLKGQADEPQIVKAFYNDGNYTAEVVARAYAIRERAGMITGFAAGEEAQVKPRKQDTLLDDLLTVWPAGADKAWSTALVAGLIELRPEEYLRLDADKPEVVAKNLAAIVGPYGIKTGQVWLSNPDDGGSPNRRGITKADLLAAITERDLKRGESGGR